MKVRVCHVCSGHYADDGRVFHRACVALAAQGYEVYLIASSKTPDTYTDEGVIIHPLTPTISRWRRIQRRRHIARLAGALGAALLHVHEPELLGPVLRLAGSAAVIWDVHEYYPEVIMHRQWIPKWLRPVVRKAWDLRERTLIKRCVAIVAATERLAQRYRALHDHVVVIPNVPDLDVLNTLPPARRETHRCVYAGSIGVNRGLEQSIEAIGLLHQRGVDVAFSFAGTTMNAAYLRRLLALAERWRLGTLVTYEGLLSRRDALILQNNSGIALVPDLPVGNNLWGISTKMLECMSLGLPIVYSNIPSHAEVGDAHGVGISVDSTRPEQIAQAIERLVKDPQLSAQYGRSGVQAVEKFFNWRLERIKLLELYNAVVQRIG